MSPCGFDHGWLPCSPANCRPRPATARTPAEHEIADVRCDPCNGQGCTECHHTGVVRAVIPN